MTFFRGNKQKKMRKIRSKVKKGLIFSPQGCILYAKWSKMDEK